MRFFLRFTNRRMKYLRLYPAILRIKLNKTIVFLKKKIYFCGAKTNYNVTKNTNFIYAR